MIFFNIYFWEKDKQTKKREIDEEANWKTDRKSDREIETEWRKEEQSAFFYHNLSFERLW